MGHLNKLAFLGLPFTFVAVYILQSWSSSNEIFAFSPVKPLKLGKTAQAYGKITSLYTTMGPTTNEYATNEGTGEDSSQDGDHTLVERRTPMQGYASSFESTSKSDEEKQDGDYKYVERHTSKTHINTTENATKSVTKYSVPDQTVEYALTQSSLCDKPPRDVGFDELHRRYRHCMGRLVSLALEDDQTPLDEQTPYEEFGLLIGDGWREMAGRLASVKKGCRVPAVEFTGAPVLADVVFDKTHHLAYCRHGKAGTTSLLSFLLWLNHIDPTPMNTTELHRRIFGYLRRPARESQRDLLERSFSFTAVRHPFRRLVSAYCDKEVENKLDILPPEIRIMSQEEREVELLEYNYKVKLDSIEPTLMAGPWIRRAVTDRSLPEGGQDDGSLLAHYLSEVNLNSTQEGNLIESTIDIQGVYSEGGRNQTNPTLSSAEPFRMFVHGVALDLLKCGSDTSCLGLTDRHINPQVIRWNPCVLNFDMVMKVETLDQDIELLKDLLGLPGPLAEGGEDPIGSIEEIHEERMEDDLNSVLIQKKLSSMMAEPQSDDAGSEESAGNETETYKEIDGFGTIENQVGNRNIVGNTDKTPDSGEKVTSNSPKAKSQFNRDTSFFRRNTSGKKCGTYEENMKQLSQRDIDILYTGYYWDFKLFGYEPFD